MKRAILAVSVLCAVAAFSMPTKEEIAEAQSIVGELMADHIAANKKGRETSEAVGDAAMALAGDAEGEAAKFVLFKGAVSYYAKARAYDKAADAIEAIIAQVDGVPPQTLYAIASKASANATAEKPPRLFALKKALGARAKAANSLAELEQKLKKTPRDSVLKRAHAELVAASGDWEAALKEFIALSGTIGLIAESEAGGKAADAAEFWWTYTAAAPEAQGAIKEHAAELYRRALENGELDGLKRNLAEKRIAEQKDEATPASAGSSKSRSGLVGHWRFNGDARDSSPFHNDGIMRGVEPCEDRYGQQGKALRFDRGKYVEVPDSPSLRNITKAFTISAWVRPTAFDGGNMCIMQKGNQSSVQLRWQSIGGKACIGALGALDVRENCSWALNEWQQGVVTYEYGKDARVYRNGQPIGIGRADKEWVANNLPLLIGYDPAGRDEYFIGAMDDVRLYNRALSEKEVATLYRSEAPSQTAALKVEYKFNYRLNDKGEAFLCCPRGGEPCVSPKPEGPLVIPYEIDGHKVVGLDDGVFIGCDKMTRIVLPKHLREHGWYWGCEYPGGAFHYCRSLNSIEVAKDNPHFTSFDGAWYTKDKKTLLAYPKTRKEIRLARECRHILGGAFDSCCFVNAKIPEGVDGMHYWIFINCQDLETIDFPKSFTNWIGAYCFGNCPKLRKVRFHGDAPAAYVRRNASRNNCMSWAPEDLVVEVKRGTRGWNGPGSTNLPARWPLDGSDSRPIRYIQ